MPLIWHDHKVIAGYVKNIRIRYLRQDQVDAMLATWKLLTYRLPSIGLKHPNYPLVHIDGMTFGLVMCIYAKSTRFYLRHVLTGHMISISSTVPNFVVLKRLAVCRGHAGESDLRKQLFPVEQRS